VPASSSKTATRSRLDPEVFELPVDKLRSGYYTDAYFNHSRATLLEDGRRPHVVVQVFQKNESFLGGMDEAIAIVKLCSHEWEGLTVRALHDGDAIAPYEAVLTIEGDYTSFAHLETVYLGTLARRTLITQTLCACWRRQTASRSSSCRRGTTTTASRRATGTPRTSRAGSSARRSASRPTTRRRGGAASASAPCRTR
jgi:hypothetical protein